MPVTAEEVCQAAEVPMEQYLSARGISKERLAEALAQELEAGHVTHIKVKALVADWHQLPEGYRPVFGSADESVIEYVSPDWRIRKKARIDAQKLLGLYPADKIQITGIDEAMSKVIAEVMDKSRGKLPSELEDSGEVDDG